MRVFWKKLAKLLLIGITVLAVNVFSPLSSRVTAQSSTTIRICALDYTTSVTTITFPSRSPSSTVSNPYNNFNGSSNSQSFGQAGIARPVVTLVNTDSNIHTIWYNISSFTNGVVANEYFLINDKGAACTSASKIVNAVEFGTNVSTGVSIGAIGSDTAKKDLYLKITLANVWGRSGSSTITILGEP